jgi:hypothetical protein
MNQSKKYDPRFKLKWLLAGAIQKQKIDISLPFIVDTVGSNELTGWYTISCLSLPTIPNDYTYFVTKRHLKLGRCNKLPNDALDLNQGLKLVKLVKMKF